MPNVSANGKRYVTPSLVLTADKSFPSQYLKSHIPKSGKKTLILWHESNMYGKTTDFGMAFVTMNLDQKMGSGENSGTRMNPTEKQYTISVTPKGK